MQIAINIQTTRDLTMTNINGKSRILGSNKFGLAFIKKEK